MSTSVSGSTGIEFTGSGNQVEFADGSIQNTAATGFGFKNRLINGNMDIWQRGTSATGAYVYGADRWATGPFTSAQTISRSTSVPSGSVAQYSLSLQRPAASTSTTSTVVMQVIESNNCYDLAGQQVTISFWAKAGANFSAGGNNMNVQVATGTAADQGGVAYYAWTGLSGFNNSQSITTTWTRYSFTGTIGSGVLEIAVLFYFVPVGTAGADDAVYITGVQLEKGAVATAFDYRPYGTELALCQRYYQTSGVWANYQYMYAATIPANYGLKNAQFGTTMRTSATAVAYSESGVANRFSINRGGAYTAGYITESTGFTLTNATGGGVNITELTFSWTASAEL